MKERGFAGSDNIDYYEAIKWLQEKYDAWLIATPRYLTPIEFDQDYYDDPYEKKTLMWEIDSRDTTSYMSGDYYCRYFSIHHEDEPEAQSQAFEDADVFGLEVCEASGKFYKSPEDALCAGLILTMLWIDPRNS